RREAPDTLERALDGGAEQQLIAGLNGFAEARLVDTDEIETRLIVRSDAGGDEREDPRRLCQRFDDNDAGHDRAPGEMAGKIRLVDRHVLQRADALARV